MIKIKIKNHKEKLIGGAGDNRPDDSFDPQQLAIGVADETGEHTPDPQIGKEIAKDHLTKDPDYYRKIKAAGLDEKMNEIKNFDHKQFKDWLNKEIETQEQTDDKLLVETKLSKYWKARAARRAKNAERSWPNKTDRDWALSQQDKSSKMNDTIHNLFQKDLEESEEMLGEIDDMMRDIKKKRKALKLKREAAKLMKPQDRLKKKKSLSRPYPKHKKGETVGGYYRKAAKKLGGVGAAPGETIGMGGASVGVGGGGVMEEQKEKNNENN